MRDAVKEIVRLPVSMIEPFPGNPRIMSGENMQRLAASLDRFGLVDPLIVNRKPGKETYRLVGGHQRYKVLCQSGIEEVWAAVVELSDEEEKALNVALNNPNLQGEYDLPALSEMMKELPDDLVEVAGFSKEELAAIQAAGDNLPEPIMPSEQDDDVPEPPEKAQSQRGVLYQCGRHRVLCGDCTVQEDVARLLGGKSISAVVTDPPYGIEREGIVNDDPKHLAALYRGALSAMALKDAVIIAFQSPRLFPVWLNALCETGCQFRRALWFYEPFSPASGTRAYPWHGWYMQGEIILVALSGEHVEWPEHVTFVSDTYQHEFGDARVTERGSVRHPTVKPLWIVRDLVAHLCGDVLDPFLGSGTTLIACEQLKRRCFGLEIEPRYVDVIRRRWAELIHGKDCDWESLTPPLT